MSMHMSSLTRRRGTELADSYTIQSIEDNIIGKNRTIYMDSYDVIKLIQGAKAFESSGAIDHNAFANKPDSLVLALAYKGWLGTIKILPPHHDELIDKFTRPENPFSSFYSLDAHSFALEILAKMNLEFLIEENEKKIEAKIKYYTKEFTENARGLFKLNQLLNEYYWNKRYHKLFRDIQKDTNAPIIDMDNQSYEVERIVKSELFRALRSAFDHNRKKRDRRKNNVIDALSFCILQEKLNAHLANKKEVPLPVFYVSEQEARTSKALRQVMEEHADKKWFTYDYKGTKIPIIRDADFFILDVVFSPNNQMKELDEFFYHLKHIKDLVNIEYSNYEYLRNILGKDDYENFRKRTQEIIDIEFFNNIWLKNKKKINEEIKNYITYNKNIENEVRNVLKREKNEIQKELKSTFSKNESLEKVHLLKEWIFELCSIKPKIQSKLVDGPEDQDIYLNFALMRVSLLQEFYDKHIKHWIEDLKRNVEEENDDDLNANINAIASILLSSVYGNQNEETIAALTILWIFDQDKLIDQVCKRFNNQYEHYSTALIHAVSLIRIGNPDTKRVMEICECIEGKAGNEISKNAKIGLSFVYYRCWHPLVDSLTLLCSKSAEEQEKIRNNPYFELIQKARASIKEAYSWLLEKHNDDIEKISDRKKRYFYALNNDLYFTTQIGALEEFQASETAEQAITLSRVKNDGLYWQPRFDDTLALYYYRSAVHSEFREEFEDYIDTALRHNNSSIDSTIDDRAKYESLKDEMKSFKYRKMKEKGWIQLES